MPELTVAPRVAIAAIMKNEGPYVLEWLAWHRLIGIGTFLIADNGSDDGMSALLVALDRAGVITRIDFPQVSTPGDPAQEASYRAILAHHAAAADWILFMDADEFLRPRQIDGGLARIIASIPGDVGAVAINWMVFGSSWRTAPGSGPVMGRFAYRSTRGDGMNRHYKTLVRTAAASGTLRNPHHIDISDGFRWVDTAMQDLVLQGTPGRSAQVLWGDLWIQHYVLKSWSEYWHKKFSRGRATGATGTFDDRFFEGHDKNTVYDALPPGLHHALLKEIRQIRTLLSDRVPDLPPAARDLDLAIGDLATHRVVDASVPATLRAAAPRGVIDQAVLRDGDLEVRGWIMTGDMGLVDEIGFLAGDTPLRVAQIRRIERTDVQAVYPGAPRTCGYLARIDAADLGPLRSGAVLRHCIAARTRVVGTPVEVQGLAAVDTADARPSDPDRRHPGNDGP